MRSARPPGTRGCASPRPPPRGPAEAEPGDERRASSARRIAVLIASRTVLSPRVRVHRRSRHRNWSAGHAPAAETSSPDSWLAVTGNPAAYTAPAGCALPVVADPDRRPARPPARRRPGGLGASVAVRRYRQSDRSFLADLRTRPGFAPGVGDPRAPVRESRAAPRQPAPPRPRPPRSRPTSGGGSGGPGGWTCTCPSKTPSPWKARPGPGRATGC